MIHLCTCSNISLNKSAFQQVAFVAGQPETRAAHIEEMNKSTRFKANPSNVFDCYCEISLKAREAGGGVREKPWIKRRFPDSYKVREVLESVPKFAYPSSNLALDDVTQFSFVLTNIESKWTFGYCQISPKTDSCIVLLSQLPWHETFFKIVAHIGSIYNSQDRQNELLGFLKALYQCKIPERPENQLVVQFNLANGRELKFNYEIPDHHSLASIPHDRNLTEYYNALDVENMIILFASALNERHILVTSKKLDRLSACVQALNSLLYPMHWQHIFISVLPSDLLAYLQAPMPFLIGVPEPTYKKLKLSELGDVVLVLADDNVVQTPHDDVKNLPAGVANKIRSELKNQVALGDSVSRAFLRALVMLIGGYREALEFNDGDKITFNHERFIATRSISFQPFLRKMLELQMFRQFIEGRLEMLNSGKGFNDDFEFEVNVYEERVASRVNLQYQDWLNDMKTKSGVLLRSINPSLKLMYSGMKDKSKRAYKEWKLIFNAGESSGPGPQFFYNRMN